MIKTAAKLVVAWVLGLSLALSPVHFAAAALAACADAHPTVCPCGACAEGCTCCVKPTESPVAPIPMPAVPAPTLMQDWAATAPLAGILCVAMTADSSCFPAPWASTITPVKVPIFTRHCAFLI